MGLDPGMAKMVDDVISIWKSEKAVPKDGLSFVCA
jgi:hypothetical protein